MKKLLGYLPFHFLICLVIGIFIQYSTDLWTYDKKWLWYALLAIVILLAIVKRTILFQVFTWVSFVLLGVYVTHQNNDRNHALFYQNHHSKNTTYVLHIREVLKANQYSNRYKAEVVQVGGQSTLGKVLLSIQKDTTQELSVDDQIITSKDFIEVRSPLNPYQFDYKSYLAKEGIYHQAFLTKEEFLRVESKPTFLGRIAKIRNSIQTSLKEEGFSKDEYGVINALLLGQRQELSRELSNDYSRAGAIHILAVSGLHVGIILLLLSMFFKPVESLKYGKIIKLILILLCLWFFAILAGMSASVVRAVTMFSAVAIGLSLQRKNSVEFSLVFSMFVLLLIQPMFLFDVGFQLSYLAVFGIVTIQPKLYELWSPKFWLLNKAWQLTTVSVAAQLAVLPVSLYYFHQFPGLFLLSNLVIVPFLGMILIGGVLIIVLSLCSILPDFLVMVYGSFISYMNSFVRFISQQETFLFSDISFSLGMLLSSYLMIVMGFRFFEKRRVQRLIGVLGAVLIFQGVILYEKHATSQEKELIVFHKRQSSMMILRQGNDVQLYHSLDSAKRKNNYVLKSYLIGENLSVEKENSLINYLEYKEEDILLIDSLGIYTIEGVTSPIVILQNSPRINLKRLINELEPKQIVADGSNYRSYVTRWEKTCMKTKTPFWFTGQNGAYILK